MFQSNEYHSSQHVQYMYHSVHVLNGKQGTLGHQIELCAHCKIAVRS